MREDLGQFQEVSWLVWIVSLFVDHYFRRFHDYFDRISNLKIELLCCCATDQGYNFNIANVHDDLGHHISEFHGLHRSCELIPGANHGILLCRSSGQTNSAIGGSLIAYVLLVILWLYDADLLGIDDSIRGIFCTSFTSPLTEMILFLKWAAGLLMPASLSLAAHGFCYNDGEVLIVAKF